MTTQVQPMFGWVISKKPRKPKRRKKGLTEAQKRVLFALNEATGLVTIAKINEILSLYGLEYSQWGVPIREAIGAENEAKRLRKESKPHSRPSLRTLGFLTQWRPKDEPDAIPRFRITDTGKAAALLPENQPRNLEYED